MQYHEEGDSYVIMFATGGKGRYPKKIVDRFEPAKKTPASAMRTWTENDGKHKVEAELVAVQDGTVTLRKADGKEVKVALKRLSEADQEFARTQSSPR